MLAQMFVSSTGIDLDPLNLEPPPPETRQRLLRFPLDRQDSALLPLEQITEVLRVNVAEILPVPEMPICVLGICNWRGEMLWIVDLNLFLGCPSLRQQEQVLVTPAVMVVQVNDQAVGLMVSQVNDIELHELEQLQLAAPGLFPPKLLPFVLGALPGGKGTVLDIKAIAQCPLWQLHHKEVS